MPKEQYMCQLCANHGMYNQPKKGHKQRCPNRHCTCDLCSLNTKRRTLDRMERQWRVVKKAEQSKPKGNDKDDACKKVESRIIGREEVEEIRKEEEEQQQKEDPPKDDGTAWSTMWGSARRRDASETMDEFCTNRQSQSHRFQSIESLLKM